MATASSDVERTPLLNICNDHSGSHARDWRRRRTFHAFTKAEVQQDVSNARHRTRHILTSKSGHYSVLALVVLDVSCIFADFVLTIVRCDSEDRGSRQRYSAGLEALGLVSLVFSCFFMLELLASIWAFGPAYFRSKFHVFDAVVISTAFIIDVVLRGVLEEVASLVVVLRLWRVFKIIEELSAGAQEQMEGMEEKVQDLERENAELRCSIPASDGQRRI